MAIDVVTHAGWTMLYGTNYATKTLSFSKETGEVAANFEAEITIRHVPK